MCSEGLKVTVHTVLRAKHKPVMPEFDREKLKYCATTVDRKVMSTGK